MEPAILPLKYEFTLLCHVRVSNEPHFGTMLHQGFMFISVKYNVQHGLHSVVKVSRTHMHKVLSVSSSTPIFQGAFVHRTQA